MERHFFKAHGTAVERCEVCLQASWHAVHLRHTKPTCYIGHPMDKPCPKWEGRNYP